jgi:quinol monooxygenase YgiN
VTAGTARRVIRKEHAMYGTMARFTLEPGQKETMRALHEKWQRERKPEAKGLIADYVLESERVPGEWFVMVLFDSEENYRKNAADPEQHRQYEEMRALMTADPEWNDGQVFAIEPSSVPV